MGLKSSIVLFAVLSVSKVASGQLSCVPGDPFSGGRALCREAGEGGCTADRYATTTTNSYNGRIDQCFGDEVNRYYGLSGCDYCAGTNIPGSRTTDVTLSLLPLDYRHFILSVSLPRMSGVQYWVRLSVRESSSCTCTTATTVNYTLQYYDHPPPKAQVQVVPFPNGSIFHHEIILPQSCGDPRLPYVRETCGLPRLQRPTDVVLECNGTHTTISWSKTVSAITPSNQTLHLDIDTFYLTIYDCTHQQSRLLITNTTTVTVNTSAVTNFTLHAYSKCSGLYQHRVNSAASPIVSCSLPLYCGTHCVSKSRRVCSGKSACEATSRYPSSPSPSSSSPSPTNILRTDDSEHFLPVYITAGAAGAVLLTVSVLLIAIIFLVNRARPRPREPGAYNPIRQSHSPSPFQTSALTIYSPSTPLLEKNVIMQGFADMRNLKMGVESLLQDTRQPRQTLVNWINESYQRASAVFCVCNQSFMSDWDAVTPSEDGAVAVQTLRLLFEGDVHSAELRKYAVVLIKPSDEEFIPPLLRSLDCFDLSDTQALARFANREHSPV